MIAILDLKEQAGNPKLLSPLTLAFVGDAVYELMVRERLAADGSMPANVLHHKAVKIVCAGAQAQGYLALESILTEEELCILKRGRNAHSTKVPKNSSPSDYRRATGVEALFGYLYLKGDLERLTVLFNHMETERGGVTHGEAESV